MYEQREIVIVPFPFSDLSAIKQRPVLILSKDIDNGNSEDLITCGITSNLKDSKHSVLIDTSALEKGDIPVKSRVKIDKIFTLNKKIIKKSLAKLNTSVFDKVRKEFNQLV